MLQKFYVSLVKDLLGYYIEFEADEKDTVQMYLQAEYLKDNVWTLPWSSIYDSVRFEALRTHRVSIKAKCGPLNKEMFIEEV